MKESIFFKRKLVVVCIGLLLCSILFLFGCEKNPSPVEYVNLQYTASIGGNIDGETSQKIVKNSKGLTVTAVPNENYRFVKWSDGLMQAERTDENVTEDITVTAIFERSVFTVKYIAGEGGTVQGELIQSISGGGKGITVTAIPNENYRFVKWSDGLTTVERTDENVTEDITVTAIFERYVFSVEYIASEGGSIQGELKQSISRDGKGTTVTAIPNENYRFVKWSDGVTTVERTDENVTEDITVTAIFRQYLFTVEYRVGEGGSIQGEAVQIVEWAKSTTNVKAVASYGYKFVKWSDGVKTATRTDLITKDKVLTAEFERITYSVTYLAGDNGRIEGNANQTVIMDNNATEVTAVPNIGYQFKEWSDGVTTATRTDIQVTNVIKVTAIFEIKMCTVEYRCILKDGQEVGGVKKTVQQGTEVVRKVQEVLPDTLNGYYFVEWSDGVKTATRTDIVMEDFSVIAYYGVTVTYAVADGGGGKIEGNLSQKFYWEDDALTVSAVANEGYVFAGWSDLSLETIRSDGTVEHNWEFLAYFEPIQKTFKYDYGNDYKNSVVSSITIQRNNLQNVKFVVPEKENYIFCGWYIDKDYTLKIANEDGLLMLGYYTFNLQTDTIYAKWKSKDDNTLTQKVLMVIVDEIHASLESSVTGKFEGVDYKMTSLERRIFSLLPTKFSRHLNDAFEGKVVFETDAYFTTKSIGTIKEPAGKEDFKCYNLVYDKNYSIEPDQIQEVGCLLGKYHSLLTTFGMNDYDKKLHWSAISGSASEKYGSIYIEEVFRSYIINNIPIQNYYNDLLLNANMNSEYNFINTYLHEFIHTIDTVAGNKYNDYHDALGSNTMEMSVKKTKLYLLCQLEKDGKLVGVPMSYWKREYTVYVQYTVKVIGATYGGGGGISVVGEDAIGAVYRVVPYGSDMSVEAIPTKSTRFVKWSDGVTTPIRHDTNIISYLNVTAIFEVIK